jgi:hypothetical protein
MEELETPTASLRHKECVITKIKNSVFYTVCRIVNMQNERGERGSTLKSQLKAKNLNQRTIQTCRQDS